LKKQNPAPLADKVSNFDEMRAGLARLDRFDLTRTPNFEPRRGPVVPGYVAAARSPILFMPLRGGPVTQVETWLAALDDANVDNLRRGFSQKTLRQWKRQHPGHRSFTVVTHPLERAYNGFCRHVLGADSPSYTAVRKTLRDTCNLPLPKSGADPTLTPNATRATFLAYLRFVRENLNGQTGMRVDPAWASQDAIVQGMAQFALPDIIMRAERLTDDLDQMARQLGKNAPPPATAPQETVPLTQIYDAEIESAAKDAYQRDYMVFGYRAWR